MLTCTKMPPGHIAIFLSILILSSSSCSTSRNFHDMNYFADSVTAASQTIDPNASVLIQPGDRLNISVAALNPAAAQQFNIGSGATVSLNTGESGGGSTQTGYLVDDAGNIQFPQMGTLHVAGFTTQRLETLVQKDLLQFLTDPIVRVNIVNFNVNVLGEVNKPGTLTVQDGKITILEAISRSGDLTINGIRNNILVVREKDGKREFGKIDLASNKIFSSPYFYLRQRDVVYVSMNKNKVLLSDARQQRNFTIISVVFASISAFALVFNALKL